MSRRVGGGWNRKEKTLVLDRDAFLVLYSALDRLEVLRWILVNELQRQ